MSPIYVPGKVVFAQVSQPLDADAQAYVNAVEVADGQRIEDPVRFAINNFVIGCKADGIWTAIKASCILAGARTRLGALTPLVGTAPTSFSFVDGDYNRKTGLVGDGSTKYLNSNRNNNADPQNSQHLSVYLSSVGSVNNALIYSDNQSETGTSGLLHNGSGQFAARMRNSALFSGNAITTGFGGAVISSSAAISLRNNGTNLTSTQTSQSPTAASIFIYKRGGAAPLYSTARLAFYSIGESLDLALLDTRVTTLINAFAAAIP